MNHHTVTVNLWQSHGTVVMVVPAGTEFESMNSVMAAAEL